MSDDRGLQPLQDGCGDTVICWSRMQAEAGQGLNDIIARKEVERRAGGGLFLWGVGNAPGAGPARLAHAGARPEVIFSVMKGAPKARDVNPGGVVAWRRFVTRDGVERPLPKHSLVTSRASRPSAATPRHYALVCRSSQELRLGDHGPFNHLDYRNFGGTGAPIGSSQVTAMLRRVANLGDGAYRANIVAALDHDLWVRLSDPVPVRTPELRELDRVTTDMTTEAWLEMVAAIRESAPAASSNATYQPALL